MHQVEIGDFAGFEEYAPKDSNDWLWRLSDLKNVPSNGLKVFSCFACGGGSTMGYKLAGCEVLGCCEIDRGMNEIYIANHNPKYNFCMDLRHFNNISDKNLPQELFDLDILDGSPPCTTFSMAGTREASWGKKKKFREGQIEQTLDDLPFVFIDTVNKLRPKCVIMENVEGLLRGGAWKYVQRIYGKFHQIGYQVKHWLLRGERMGIPQTRHRVFFIALRPDIDYDLWSLDLGFHYRPVLYGTIKTGTGAKISKDSKTYDLLQRVKRGEKDLSDANMRVYGKDSMFNSKVLYDDTVCCTLTANSLDMFRYGEWTRITKEELIKASTFPEDFDFINPSITNICYVTGMSVPPVMIKRIVNRVIDAGIFSTINRKGKTQ